MYSDSHVHTSFSGDSETDPRMQIERAISLGMKQLTFTDHYDMDFPGGDLTFLFDVPAYFDTMRKLAEEYADRIDLGIGVELGLQPHLGECLPDFAAAYPFDFIIGSTHVSRRKDPYEAKEFFAGIPEEEAIRIYFEEELENLKRYDCYDIAGHLDYAVRYAPNHRLFYTRERYADLFDEMLLTVISKGKGIEYNTGGFRSDLGHANPMPAILKRYRELGGEILTIGSDAHTPDVLGSDFDRAAGELKALGFRYYTVFRGRKPQFFPL